MRKFSIALAVSLSCLSAYHADAQNERTSILFTGDILLDRGVRQVIERKGADCLFTVTVDTLFRAAQAVVGNLECPATKIKAPVQKRFIFRAEPEWLECLKAHGITHLNLANNHSIDQGRRGLTDTRQNILKADMVPIGAGATITEASEPVLLTEKPRRVWLVPSLRLALENFAYLDNQPCVSQEPMDSLLMRVHRLRRQEPDAVIVVSLHWGAEHQLTPTPSQRLDAHRLIDAGADALVCHHTHTMQTIEHYRGAPIYYSIGNFIFDPTRELNAKACVVQMDVTKQTVDFKTIPVTIRQCVPHLDTNVNTKWQYVDPRIGSVGVGRTFPGPSMPYGMVKPGPDCTVTPNAGWAPMPEVVTGFSQTHVSGTGGGQKYGNILIMPYLDSPAPQHRQSEDIALGYYTTTFENGIRTEITTSERCAHYRFHFPGKGNILIDPTHFLGKDTVPDLRERQQFVGSELEAVSDHEVRGFSRVRGGWNNGDAYTVYFSLQSDQPFRYSEGHLSFSDTLVTAKVGISYISAAKAAKNIDSIDFPTCLSRLRQAWESTLSKVDIEGTDEQKRMFYTGLYHTMLMPIDKTGENPKWTETPYYDDYYAIWDTYRTSSPLITLLDPDRETAIVNSLLNIYKREGYMPDARSGDCNGRTQGGSNAEVVIADAYAKHLSGIDYELALEAMLKDGEEDPGADHEKHGRGGLNEYKRLGYVPYGIPRAGNRTVEYAFCDWCVAQVARGLGRDEIAENYAKRSKNWHNLWRTDYEYDGMRGFILPRDADGHWLDSVVWGQSKVIKPKIPYCPTTKVAPWYVPWWSTFFYEATSEEYSLSIPHDVEGLIEACGGAEQFRKRLDLFFEKGYYNVQNEPSFLTPCLYHWIGRPDLSTQRIHQIIRDHYTDRPDGLPGNDDSGAMSSWLAFHMMGLYPLAGTDVYLLNLPLLKEYTLHLPNGRQLHVSTKGQGDGFGSVSLNGKEIVGARVTHQELLEGGKLSFEAGKTDSKTIYSPPSQGKATGRRALLVNGAGGGSLISFTLNRQFRTWPFGYDWQGDTLIVSCKATRYMISQHIVDRTDVFCWENPQNDGTVHHNCHGTFGFISRAAFAQLCKEGRMKYDGITWRRTTETDDYVECRADVDRTVMRISKRHDLPLVLLMQGNPLGIDWQLNVP